MTEKLNQWQQDLVSRFGSLASSRADISPVFALEHGLDATLEELTAALSDELSVHGLRQQYWLVWVVFASECGYRYTGDEFWQSFDRRLPTWYLRENRRLIRVWFNRFAKTYAGARPSGPWARHFSIIAWPITHAILPRDLQRQFARTLHNARFRLANADGEPQAIGRILLDASWQASSRFQQFCEQEQLVGQIALAMLGQFEREEDALLCAATTRRIVHDLEQTGLAKTWLAETRAHVSRMRGTRGKHSATRASAKPAARTGSPSVRSTLLLRPTPSGHWAVYVEQPALAALISDHPALKAFFRSAQYQIAGGAGSWMPAERLMGVSRAHLLSTWPGSETALIRFKPPPPAAWFALRADTLENAVWVCRLGSDGIAGEVLGRQVRPGNSYILLHVEALPPAAQSLCEPVTVDCEGIQAHRLALPDVMTASHLAAASALELSVCQTVRVWPAGLAARAWDGEGVCEWLTTESPMFGVAHDHPVDALGVCIGAEPEVEVPRTGQLAPCFFRIAPLPVGDHYLKVRVVKAAAASQSRSPEMEGLVLLRVRDPTGGDNVARLRGGMTVLHDPVDLRLEDLEHDRVTFNVHGPAGWNVDIELELPVPFSKTYALSKRTLPFELRTLRGLLSQTALDDLALSARATFVLKNEDLGSLRLPLERENNPLRWAYRREGKHPQIRLIDEAGKSSPPTVAFWPLTRPSQRESLDYDDCVAGLAPQSPGGLYSVVGTARTDTVLVSLPPATSSHSLRMLHLGCDLGRYGVAEATIGKDLEFLTLWRNARVVGHLGSVRRQQVVRAMERSLVGLVCGAQWREAEARFSESIGDDDAVAALGACITFNRTLHGYAAKIRYSAPEIAHWAAIDRATWLAGVGQAFGVSGDLRLVELALRFATAPTGLPDWSAEHLTSDVHRLMQYPTVARGARFLYLCLDPSEWTW